MLRSVFSIGDQKCAGMEPFGELLRSPLRDEDLLTLDGISAALKPDDPINIQFTSGTTGSPKGATLTHRNIVNNAYMVGGVFFSSFF
mgnify:CR=1 FL=1